MNADQVRAKLHQHVSAGDFDDLNRCRGLLHQAVNEFMDWCVDKYNRGWNAGDAGELLLPPSLKVLGTIFLAVLTHEAPPRVAEDRSADDAEDA